MSPRVNYLKYKNNIPSVKSRYDIVTLTRDGCHEIYFNVGLTALLHKENSG